MKRLAWLQGMGAFFGASLSGARAPIAVRLAPVVRAKDMILVCGPTYSGKSTTLYSMVREILDRAPFSIPPDMIEDPIELRFPLSSR